MPPVGSSGGCESYGQVYVETILSDTPVGFWRMYDSYDCSGNGYTAQNQGNGFTTGHTGQTGYNAATYSSYFNPSNLDSSPSSPSGGTVFDLGYTSTAWATAALASSFSLELWAQFPSGTLMFPYTASYNYARCRL